ncbi:MAG: DEAD/DEAH box helicase family protein, partial [Agathobacter sp.]|nr:DEAD/DEAH box helicase family protein [Agathobacter sp.]
MKEKLLEQFKQQFGEEGDIRIYFAPGRVNLIGEHTDYNGGHVFPCALTIGTYGVARKREDRKLRFYSMNFGELGVIESDLDDLTPYPEANWTNYPKGVIWAFGEKGMEIPCGMDLLLYGNIPNGSGLSSSASVEVLTGYILRDFWGYEISNQDLALIGQFSENKYKLKEVEINLNYPLTEKQKELSDKLIQNYLNRKNSLVNAVCGAGKTEIVIEVIKLCLKEGGRVGFAIPRRDVVIEIFHRLKDIFINTKCIYVCGGH